jgi:tetratricopeptide (TPR) repeat protein
LGEAGAALLAEVEAESVEAVLINQTIALGHYNQGHYDLFRRLTQHTAEFIQRLPYTAELGPAYFHIILGLQQEKQMAQGLQWIEHLEKVAAEKYDLRALAEAQDFRGGTNLETGRLWDPQLNYGYALDLFAKIGDNSRLWRGLGSVVWHSLLRGQLDEAMQYVTQELEVAERLALESARAETLFNLGLVHLSRRDWAEAEAAFGQAEQLAATEQTAWLKWAAPYGLGRVYLAQVQRPAALRQFQVALAEFEPFARQEWQFRWWPFLVGILSGLEAAFNASAEFQHFCQNLPTAKQRQITGFLPGPRFLEPATPAHLPPAGFSDNFSEQLAPGWTWHDPFADCAFTVGGGLQIQAVNGRDLWQANHSAPRLLRPVANDFILQTICGPLNDSSAKPAIGGLLLWQDSNNFVRLVWGNRGPLDLSFEGCLAGKDMTLGRGRLFALENQREIQAFLRLERQGQQVRALASADGVQWYTVGQVALPFSDPIQAGIHAVGWIDRTIYPGAYPEGTAIRFESVQLWLAF